MELIHVQKRSAAVVEEHYTLEIDEKKYKEYMEKNPEATAEEVAQNVEGQTVDYELSVDDITMLHEASYELN